MRSRANSQLQPLPELGLSQSRFSAPYIFGYLFLVLSFLLAVYLIYQWQYRDPAPVRTQICIQVMTPARNAATGEIREFSTPCDVPDGWEQLTLP